MKKISVLFLSIILTLTLCGCDVKLGFEDFSISQIMSELKSYFYDLGENEQVIEIVEEYYVSEPQFDSCYNALNSKQKKIYKKLYSIAETMPEGFVKLCESYNGLYVDISLAYKALLYDHAEIFWMPDTYLLGRSKSAKTDTINIAFSYTGENSSVEYAVTPEERDEMRIRLVNEITKVLIPMSDITDEYEKEKFINDYICANTEYVKDAQFVDTAYGCIVLKKALCEGYSKAFKLLCNEVGIECDLIVGIAEDVGHMWNVVNIDKKHSFVDVTWNDQKESSYTYFNITQNQIEFDHVTAPLFKERTDDEVLAGKQGNFFKKECTYTGNSYYKKTDNILDYGDEEYYADIISDIIIKKAQKGEYFAEVLIESDILLKEFKKNEEKFLNKVQYKLKDFVIVEYSLERDILTVFLKNFEDVEE